MNIPEPARARLGTRPEYHGGTRAIAAGATAAIMRVWWSMAKTSEQIGCSVIWASRGWVSRHSRESCLHIIVELVLNL